MLKPAYNFHVHDVGIFDDLHGVGKTAWLNSGIDKPKNLRAYGDALSLFDLAAAYAARS
jgi:hypothetical protein